MKEKDLECFKHFIKLYNHQYKLNDYARTNYNQDLEYYLGWRDETKYPYAYNMVFNKLLPRSYNVLARFMEQLYQGGQHRLASARPRKRNDIPRSPRVEGLLNFQLENLNSIDERGGSFMHNFLWIFNALNWGNGICKLYWRKEERIMPRRLAIPVPKFDRNNRVVGQEIMEVMVEAPQSIYDQPYSEVIHNKLCVPHPHYKSIQKMPAFFVVYRKSLDYIKQQIDKGVFKKEALKDIGWSKRAPITGSQFSTNMDEAEAFSRSLDIEGAYFEDFDSEKMAPEVDIIEGYGKYIFPEDEKPYEVGSGYKIKGMESEAIVHIGNYKTLLSIQKNKYHVRPFFNISAYLHPELFWDMGLIRLGKTIQESYNSMANLRHQDAMQKVATMIKVRMDSDIDPAALVPKPAGIIPVEEMGDVEPFGLPDVNPGIFTEQERFFEETLSDVTGEYPYNMGQTPQRQEHVGTIYSLQAVGQARAKLLMMCMDFQGFQPFLKHMMLLNTFHLPSGAEARVTQNGQEGFVPLFAGDIHPEYDFSARYTAMEPALDKHFRANQLLQYSQMWLQNPVTSSYLQHHQWMKSIMEMVDFADTDKYLKSPEQVMKESQLNQKQMVGAKMLEAKIEDQLAASQSKRDMERDIVRGAVK